MQPAYLPPVTCAEPLPDPPYWLVTGLEWPGGQSPAEAAMVVAPDTIPRDAVSADACRLLGCADRYAGSHALRVVFISDLTQMLAAGTSWDGPGVDWLAARREFADGPHLTMYLTITERVHLLISDPSMSGPIDYERELIRQVLASKLTEDWPAYAGALSGPTGSSPVMWTGAASVVTQRSMRARV